MYTSKTGNSVEYGLSYWVVYDLKQLYLNKNRNQYVESFYTSPKLFKDLSSLVAYSCGTNCIDRGKFPENFKWTKPGVGESISLRKENILPVHWKDKRNAFLLSSIHDNDQFSSCYPLDRKSLKWCEATLFRVFEICIINAMIVYFNKNAEFKKKKPSHKLFWEILAHELVQSLLDRRSNRDYPISGPARSPVNHDVRLKEKHFSVSKHPISK